MKTVHPLNQEAQGQRNGTHEVILDFNELTAAANTQTIALFNVAAKLAVELVSCELLETFDSSDALLITTAITVGDGGSNNRFLTSTELNPSGTEIFVKGGVRATYEFTGDDTVDIFFTGTAGINLSTHTSGKLRLVFRITDAR